MILRSEELFALVLKKSCTVLYQDRNVGQSYERPWSDSVTLGGCGFGGPDPVVPAEFSPAEERVSAWSVFSLPFISIVVRHV